MSVTVKLESTHRESFGTSDDTGAAVAADSTPVVVVVEQGSAMGYTPTVSSLATGLYEVAIVCSAANGFEVGKEYTAYVTVVVDSVTARAGLCSFRVTAKNIDDGVSVATGGITAASIADGAIDLATFAADAKLGAFGILESGTAQDGSSTRIRLRAGATSLNGALVNGCVVFTGGTGALQMSTIVDYDGTTKWADLADEIGTPADATTTYVVFSGDSPLAAALRTIDGVNVEGSATLGDMIRGLFSGLLGTMLGLDAIRSAGGSGTATFYAIDGTTPRIEVIYSTNGRITINLLALD